MIVPNRIWFYDFEDSDVSYKKAVGNMGCKKKVFYRVIVFLEKYDLL